MSKCIVVTGAAGFIGSHLCEKLLSEGYRVIGIDNFDTFYPKEYKLKNIAQSERFSSFAFIDGDAGSSMLLEGIKEQVDIVIHLAAKAGVQPSLNDPQSYIQSNIGVTNVLLNWMKQREIKKMIFASSSSVYGNTLQTPFTETQNTDTPFSPYAFTKKACEVMNYTYHSLYDMDVVNLRFFTVYGERQRPDLAIHKFVAAVFNGKPIYMYGDGSSARDYTYYSDTVNGIVSALKYIEAHEKVYEIVNLGNSNPISLKTLISTISEVADIKPRIIQDTEKPGDVAITYASIQRAKQLFGYEPEIDFETGIKNFVAWYKENIFTSFNQVN